MRLGLIGCGKTGTKRALQLTSDARLVGVFDTDPDSSQRLANAAKSTAYPTAQALLKERELDAVVISTPNRFLTEYGLAALDLGKHVLLEKPGGIQSADLEMLTKKALAQGLTLGIGFNHRFHPAMQKAKNILRSEVLGPLMYFRARYGHGARVGYEHEWRANPEISGGGELLDQGVHLIDLCRWMGGEFEIEFGKAYSFFWKMPVEDNGILILKSASGSSSRAFLHASCTEWKNLFDFEIFCRLGKIQIIGLGGSYGTEELRVYKVTKEMGPPQTQIEQFTEVDSSWKSELAAFIKTIRGESTDLATGHDGVRALEMVETVYRS